VGVVEDAERPVVRLERELQLARFENQTVVVSEHRNEHPVHELGIDGRPVDVEELAVDRGRPVLEHVHPPGVVGAHHPHVVGDHVENLAHAVRLQRCAEALEALRAAEVRIERVVVDDVVAVRAVGAGAQAGRAVNVAHAEHGEVGHELRGVREREVGIELQAIGRARNPRAARVAPQGPRARVRAQLRERARELGEALVGRPAFERQRELAPPVRVLGGGSREVHLFARADHVLELNRQHARGAAGEVLLQPAQQRGGHLRQRSRIRALGEQPFALERAQQARPVLHARVGLAPARFLAGELSESLARREVASFPIACKRGQVVGRRRHERLGRVFGRGLEFPRGLPLEQQHTVGEDPDARERRTDLVGHGAEVLTDHHAAVALALERDDAEQVVERIVHVGAVAGLSSAGHPEQPREPHDVVDAKRPGVAHVGAQRGDEWRVGGRAQPLGRERRQSPVLAAQVEIIRRGTDARLDGVQALVRPRFRAAAVDRDGEVLVQSHAQAQVQRQPADRGKLQVGLPLQVFVELDAPTVRLGEARDLGRRGIAVGLGPRRPAPDLRVLAVEMLLQRLEQRVAPERGGMRGLIGTERPRARRAGGEVARAEMGEAALEHRQLQRRDACVVHERRVAQRPQPHLEFARAGDRHRLGAIAEIRHRLDVDVQDVEEAARRGTVGARVLRVVGKQRVQGIDAHDAGAAAAPLAQQRGEVGEVADAPVAPRSQRVELRRRAPHALFALHGHRVVAARGRDDERRFGERVAVAQDRQAVIAAGHAGDGSEIACDESFAFEQDGLGRAQRGRIERAFVARAVLLGDAPAERWRVGGQIQSNRPRRGRVANDDCGRENRAPASDFTGADRVIDLLRRCGLHAQGGEQRAQARVGNLVARAPDVEVIAGDAMNLAQAPKRLKLAHSRPPA